MYRDDLCAVCGDSLPPDHLYCRDHAAVVDDILHEIGDRLPRLRDDLARVATLVDQIHPDTWDFVAEQAGQDDDVIWPPRPTLAVTVDGDDVEVDVDREPGRVSVSLVADLAEVLRSVAAALGVPGLGELAQAASEVTDAGATH